LREKGELELLGGIGDAAILRGKRLQKTFAEADNLKNEDGKKIDPVPSWSEVVRPFLNKSTENGRGGNQFNLGGDKKCPQTQGEGVMEYVLGAKR